MIDRKKVKEMMFSLGADLCGIASIDRFADAPKGYHPLDVLPICKSVISFACRFPVGTIGRHSLLITPEFGSMVWLGAVLCEQEFEPDKMLKPLCNNCNLCVESCPINALESLEINQQSCWDFAFGDDEEEKTWRISCHKCRDICPYNLGSQNSFLWGR